MFTLLAHFGHVPEVELVVYFGRSRQHSCGDEVVHLYGCLTLQEKYLYIFTEQEKKTTLLYNVLAKKTFCLSVCLSVSSLPMMTYVPTPYPPPHLCHDVTKGFDILIKILQLLSNHGAKDSLELALVWECHVDQAEPTLQAT